MPAAVLEPAVSVVDGKMMQISVLGPVTVRADNDAEVGIGGPRVRALLALLALDAGRVVSDSRLVEGIWAEDRPAVADNALQTLVRRLRAALPSIVIQRSDAGYMLCVEPAAVDAHRFARLLDEGKSQLTTGHPQSARESLDAALSLWNGPALAGLPAQFDTTATFLTEQRFLAMELRAEAYLATRRGEEITRELTAEVAAHPFRETLVARLIDVLAATGRHADASQLYQRTRELLHTELGSGPSAELRAAMAALTCSISADNHMPLNRTDPLLAPSDSDDLTGRIAGPSAPLATETSRLPFDDIKIVVPRRLTSFVGREEDAARVAQLLAAHRLVTLVGAGGVGKTRLATEVVHSTRTGDGCLFIDLATLARETPETSSRAVVGRALVAAVMVDPVEEVATDCLEVLAHVLHERPVLLILDNCEHVVSAIAEVIVGLLDRLPALRVLATSREPLDVDGEQLYPVRTLPLPDTDTSVDEARERAAVRLFLDRATAVHPNYPLTEDNYADVCAIVRRLDGVPLAIELAAARLQALPVSIIADRLGDRFHLLTNGTRHAVPRHRTLHAAVSWSWELLTEPETRLAQRIAVFVGGATLHAIEQICTETYAPPGADPVLDTLMSLVTKSLVEFDGHRYRMVETIRAYATAELDASDDQQWVQRRHADFFIELAESGADGLRSGEQRTWLDRLAAEHANTAAALRWAIDTADVERTTRLYANLIWYWKTCGQHSEVLAWHGEVLATIGDNPLIGHTGNWLTCHYAQHLPSYDQYGWWGRIPKVSAEFDRLAPLALREPRSLPPLLMLVHALRESHRGNGQALAECASAQDGWLRGSTLVLAAYEEADRCRPDQALIALDRAVAALTESGEPRALGRALATMAIFRVRVLSLHAAEHAIERLTGPLLEHFGARLRIYVLLRAAQVYLVGGDTTTGAMYLARAEAEPPEGRDLTSPFLAGTRGDMALRQGKFTEAIRHYRQICGDPDHPTPPTSEHRGTAPLVDHICWRVQYAKALAGSGRPDAALHQLAIARELTTAASPMLLADVGLGYVHAALSAGAAAAAAQLLPAIDRLNKSTGRTGLDADLSAVIETAQAALSGDQPQPTGSRDPVTVADTRFSPEAELSELLDLIVPGLWRD